MYTGAHREDHCSKVLIESYNFVKDLTSFSLFATFSKHLFLVLEIFFLTLCIKLFAKNKNSLFKTYFVKCS